jgi:hypothetical protein
MRVVSLTKSIYRKSKIMSEQIKTSAAAGG